MRYPTVERILAAQTNTKGWVTPKGEVIELYDTSHEDVLAEYYGVTIADDRTDGVDRGDVMERAHREGWIGFGHGEVPEINADLHVLRNPRCAAMKGLKRALESAPEYDGAPVEFSVSGKLGRVFLDLEHFLKRGSIRDKETRKILR